MNYQAAVLTAQYWCFRHGIRGELLNFQSTEGHDSILISAAHRGWQLTSLLRRKGWTLAKVRKEHTCSVITFTCSDEPTVTLYDISWHVRRSTPRTLIKVAL